MVELIIRMLKVTFRAIIGKLKLNIQFKGPFRILCQLGKIENTKGHKYENRDRCRAIC